MKTLVKTKSLLDGTGAMPIPQGWMLLENGKIQAVGKPGELAGVEGVGAVSYTHLRGIRISPPCSNR